VLFFDFFDLVFFGHDSLLVDIGVSGFDLRACGTAVGRTGCLPPKQDQHQDDDEDDDDDTAADVQAISE
jgi:hypothetical protein